MGNENNTKIVLSTLRYKSSPIVDNMVDVGLSHIGLFPHRFNSNGDKSAGTSSNKYRYTYDGIFNTDTFKKINNWLN